MSLNGIIFGYAILGLIQAVILTTTCFAILDGKVFLNGQSGVTGNMWNTGSELFTNIVIIVNFKVVQMSYNPSLFLYLSILLTLLFYFMIAALYD
ncbi:MAG: hypothetical protein ACK56F_29025, partial [bacterium]